MKNTEMSGTPIIGRLLSKAKVFAKDESGLAMVEYAMTLPFMAGMFVGFGAIATGQHINNRVSDVGKTVSDIISQSASISADQIDAAMKAGEAIAGSTEAKNIKIEVIGVEVDSSKRAKVVWARGTNTSSLPSKNSIFPLPASLKKEAKFVVVARTSLYYTPKVGSSLTGSIPFNYTYYSIPRVSFDTRCKDC